jgi:alkaline phosphatase D
MRRRDFLKATALTPFLVHASRAETANPYAPAWVVAGDVTARRAKIAAGGLGFGSLELEWSTRADGWQSRYVRGGVSRPETDGTAQALLTNLPAGREIFFRARIGNRSAAGRFRTAPESPDQAVRFVWGGDVAGQGWGIDPSRQGMLTFRSMMNENPDFFIHCGDSIYADDPLPSRRVLDDGSVWSNIVSPEKRQAATTLKQFQGNYRYNFLDDHYRRFFARVPVIAQWDDHEVFNNWSPTRDAKPAGFAFQAFQQYWPMQQLSPRQLYRKISFGPNLDVFVLDLRSYRADNSENRQKERGPETVLLGRQQLSWLKKELSESQAVWKVMAGEMPISTHSPKFGLDNWANGDGPPLGRELELAELLSFVRKKQISNLVWLSADVHYAMAIEYNPELAVFKDFLPFWEFVAGPLHAGTFAPSEDLDPTFGAIERFCAVPRLLPPNRPPSEDLQFYGKVAATANGMSVSLHNRRGKEIYRVELRA